MGQTGKQQCVYLCYMHFTEHLWQWVTPGDGVRRHAWLPAHAHSIGVLSTSGTFVCARHVSRTCRNARSMVGPVATWALVGCLCPIRLYPRYPSAILMWQTSHNNRRGQGHLLGQIRGHRSMTCPGQCPKGPSDHSWVPIWKVENIPPRLLLICKRQLSVHLFAALVHGLQHSALVCHIYFHLFACWVFFKYFWLFKCNLPWSCLILQLQIYCYF